MVEPGLIDYLCGFLTPERNHRIKEVLEGRTNQLTVVLEDIYDPHNASAVVRTCDAFGVQTIHSIQMRHSFQPREGVSMGAGKWIDLVSHTDTSLCFEQLRQKAYTIVAASPRPDAIPLPEFKVKGRVALLLGSERDGLSDFAKENADAHITIPMRGFSESLNLSVSAAICIQSLRVQCREVLSEEEKQDLLLRWICASLRDPEGLIRRFRSGN